MKLGALDLNLLLVFEAILTERGVTAAARRLGVGQSGLSASLSRLREALGDELFVRRPGGMRPTAKAAELAPGLLAALAELRHTLETGLDFDPGTSRRSFSIGVTDYAATLLLPPLSARVAETAPGIDLHLLGYEKASAPAMLDGSAVDAALGVFPDAPEHAVVTPLFEETFVGLARRGHPALAAGGMTLDGFVAAAHVLVTVRQDRIGSIDRTLEALGLSRRVAMTLPYAGLLGPVLAGSDLVAAAPSRLAARIAVTYDVVSFSLPLDSERWTLSLMWLAERRKDPALTWLRREIAAVAAGLSPSVPPRGIAS